MASGCFGTLPPTLLDLQPKKLWFGVGFWEAALGAYLTVLLPLDADEMALTDPS